MNDTTFDTVARSLSTAVSRRSALRGVVAGALAVTAGSAARETSATRHRKAHKGKEARKPRVRRPGDACTTDQQCQAVRGDLICRPTRLFTEERVCCGGVAAACDETGGSGGSCCFGYLCASGRCIVV